MSDSGAGQNDMPPQVNPVEAPLPTGESHLVVDGTALLNFEANFTSETSYYDWLTQPELFPTHPQPEVTNDLTTDTTQLVTNTQYDQQAAVVAQPPAAPEQLGVAPVAEAPRRYVHGNTGKARTKVIERPQWNCYRCDKPGCDFTHAKPGPVTNHIKYNQDHDGWVHGVSWVGDENAKLARGFISGEPILKRLERLENATEAKRVQKREQEDNRTEARRINNVMTDLNKKRRKVNDK